MTVIQNECAIRNDNVVDSVTFRLAGSRLVRSVATKHMQRRRE